MSRTNKAHGAGDEDAREREADLKTIKAMADIQAGLYEPIDDLVKMIEEDSRAAALQRTLIEGEESGFVGCSLDEVNRELDVAGELVREKKKYDLDELLDGVKPANLHGETDFGGPVGKEIQEGDEEK